MTIAELNQMDPDSRREALGKCCGARAWVEKMAMVFPVADKAAVWKASDEIWNACDGQDWKEAFEQHPRIGDLDSLKKKFAATGQWAAGEQSGVNAASMETLQSLADGNAAYEKKFGYTFIVCATGKSAPEMLDILRQRLENDPQEELHIAMNEQNKITRIRLEKLLT